MLWHAELSLSFMLSGFSPGAHEEVSENSTPSLFVTPKYVSWSLSCLAYLSSTDHVWSINSAFGGGPEHWSGMAKELSFNSFTAKVCAHWSQLPYLRGMWSHPWGCVGTEVGTHGVGTKWSWGEPGQNQPKEAVPPVACSQSVRCMARGCHGWRRASRGDCMSSWRRNSLGINKYAETKHV